MLRIFILYIFLFIGLLKGFSQIIVELDKTPEQLITQVLLGRNSGLMLSNVQYKGDKRALGAFYTESKYMPVNKGIILSTGLAEDADGPNESDNKGTMLQSQGDSSLQAIANGISYNASILSFVFYPSTDSIAFEYVFASEEYPEFVNKGVNDLFAFFISGQGYPKPKNIALIPDTDIPVTVDNVNANTHSHFFLENRKWNATNRAWFANHLEQGERSYNCEYDGMTVCLTAKAKVEPFEPYLLSLAITDVGDGIYDSGVFIKKQSFKSTGNKPPVIDLLASRLAQIAELQVIPETDKIRIIPFAQFEFNAFRIDSIYQQALLPLVRMLNKYFTLKINLIGYTDNIGTDEYNIELSTKRALEVSKFLIQCGIESNRIKCEGRGRVEFSDKEIDSTIQAFSRRVEIVLY